MLQLQRIWARVSLIVIAVGAIAIAILIIVLRNKKGAQDSKLELVDAVLKEKIAAKNDQITTINKAIEIEKEERQKAKVEFEKTGNKIDAMSTMQLIELAKKRRS